jgi:hypothetical protein
MQDVILTLDVVGLDNVDTICSRLAPEQNATRCFGEVANFTRLAPPTAPTKATTPTATTPTATTPPPPPQTSAAHIRTTPYATNTRLPLVVLMFIAHHMSE